MQQPPDGYKKVSECRLNPTPHTHTFTFLQLLLSKHTTLKHVPQPVSILGSGIQFFSRGLLQSLHSPPASLDYRTTQYSAPYKRNSLLGLHQYAASDQFPSLGRWDSARSDDLYVVRGTASRTQPVNIIVVGAVSSDRANLRPHGNYDPNYMLDEETIAKKAKLQFVITSPEDDPDFSADYALSLRRLKEIQEEIAASTGHRNHFIQGSNMKMNFLLFSEKVGPAFEFHCL